MSDFMLRVIKRKLEKWRYQLARQRYKSKQNGTVLDWAWGNEAYSRIAIVNFLLAHTTKGRGKYLEIGCLSNVIFHSISTPFKIGVDPVSGGTHQMTSDEFFSQSDSSIPDANRATESITFATYLEFFKFTSNTRSQKAAFFRG